MPYLAEFLTVAVIHLLAAMSPGPDLALISRNSLVYSRKTAIYTSIGLGLGILVHVIYSLLGIGFLISQSIVLFSIMKFLGAGYLIFIGYQSLKSKAKDLQVDLQENNQQLSPKAAIGMGFLSNVFNPKVTLFFLSLFTQVINPHTPLSVQIIYGLEMVMMTMIWFSIVGTLVSHPAIKTRFTKIQHHVEKVFGVILVGLGIKVALSSSK